MRDFSFLRDSDTITIDDESELNSILAEFEKACICWSGDVKATTEVWKLNGARESVKYLRIYETKGIYHIRYGTKYDFEHRTAVAHAYTVQEVLFLATQLPEEVDESEVSEIDIRQFLIS